MNLNLGLKRIKIINNGNNGLGIMMMRLYVSDKMLLSIDKTEVKWPSLLISSACTISN